MVIQLQTSFIPKKSPVIGSSRPGAGGQGVNVLAIIALAIFFIAVGLSITVFFYKSSLIQLIATMDAELAAAKKSFEPAFIEEASRFDTRIAGAQELLGSHRALSPLFDILEKKTLESMRFKDFNFTSLEGRTATLSMTGQAKSFNAVALQSDVFGAEKAFKDPVFSNFNLDDQGDVIFNFKATIDSELLRYRETVLGSSDNSEAETLNLPEETTLFDAGGDGQ
ncbi:MAG: hypothetical protein Q7R64_01600 [bacterium]|nr:hypothetical protein [bacterium]